MLSLNGRPVGCRDVQPRVEKGTFGSNRSKAATANRMLSSRCSR